MPERKKERRVEGGGEVGDGGGEGTLHLLHCIISQISEVSDIPVKRVEFAKVCEERCAHLCSPRGLPACGYLSCSQSYGSFPSEMSVLEVEDELEWNPSVPAVSSMPLSIYDDGAILYYK